MAQVLPPQPTGNASPSNWADWYEKLRRLLNGGLTFSSLDFTGSNITSIATRRHRDLQDLQGGATSEYYHLTLQQLQDLTRTPKQTVAFIEDTYQEEYFIAGLGGGTGFTGVPPNFTYDSATNTVTFGNITGSDLGMVIQSRAPTVLESPIPDLQIKGRNAAVASGAGQGINISGGAGTGVQPSGIVLIQSGTTNVQVSSTGVTAADSLGSAFEVRNGGISFTGGTCTGVDVPMTFSASLNLAGTGVTPIVFTTGTGDFMKFSEDVYGAQKIGLFGKTPVAQSSGWGAPTGVATKTTFATSTVTLPQLAERVKALIDYFKLRGDFN